MRVGRTGRSLCPNLRRISSGVASPRGSLTRSSAPAQNSSLIFSDKERRSAHAGGVQNIEVSVTDPSGLVITVRVRQRSLSGISQSNVSSKSKPRRGNLSQPTRSACLPALQAAFLDHSPSRLHSRQGRIKRFHACSPHAVFSFPVCERVCPSNSHFQAL
jgi:hypothetical protein